MPDKPQFFSACGKEFDRPSKVKGHERFCQKCKELANPTTPKVLEGTVIPSPTKPRCRRCEGPLQDNEKENGICSVCENELIIESNAAQTQTPTTPVEVETPDALPVDNPETPGVATAEALTGQMNEVIKAINKLSENQKAIHEKFLLLQPVFDHLETQKKAQTGEAPVAVAPADGDGNTSPIAPGLLGALPAITQLIQAIKGLGSPPMLGQPGANFKPLIEMMTGLTQLEEAFWEKRNAPYRAGREDTFKDIRSLAALSGHDDLSRITDIMEQNKPSPAKRETNPK